MNNGNTMGVPVRPKLASPPPKGPAQTPPKEKPNNPWRNHMARLRRDVVEVFFGPDNCSIRGRILVSDLSSKGISVELEELPGATERVTWTLSSYNYIVAARPLKRREEVEDLDGAAQEEE